MFIPICGLRWCHVCLTFGDLSRLALLSASEGASLARPRGRRIRHTLSQRAELVEGATTGCTAWTQVCGSAFKGMQDRVSCQTPGWVWLLWGCG